MYFCYAWGSWFYFGWFPVYLVKGAGFSEAQMGIFSALPFFLGTAGNLAGGFFCDYLVMRFGLKAGRRLVGAISLAASALLLLAMTSTHNHTAIVLCDLEGKSRKEAARQLGVPDGTVASRMATARTLLAKRLARHGPEHSRPRIRQRARRHREHPGQAFGADVRRGGPALHRVAAERGQRLARGAA